MIDRFRHARKAPLAVAGILATPLFFVALMAFSLWLDEPTVTVNETGAEVLGDPSRATVGKIYLLSFGVSGGIVLVGFAALFVRRVGVHVSALAAIAVTIALLLPLDTWETEHTARYPQGIDLIPRSDPGDLLLRGEWEDNAHRAARQIGFWTIAIAITAMVVATAVDIRRRRRPTPPPVPPPPEVAGGEPRIVQP
jgi:hypothetical protein